MRLFILVVTMVTSLCATEAITITCAETLRMTTVEHLETVQYKDGTWSVITVISIPVENNPWLADVFPGCTDSIMVKGIGESSNLSFARDKSEMSARGNAVCIQHPHYEHYMVYERYWEAPLYKLKRNLNIGGK